MLDRIPILKSMFGQNGHAAAAVSKRWQRAFARDPELAKDLIREGGVFTLQPVTMQHGYPEPVSPDPHRLAYEAGRRDFAILLLAQGGTTIDDLNDLLGDENVG